MKLIQLNIERNKHLDRVVPFLKNEKPDVLCLEEVMRPKVEEIATDLDMFVSYVPITVRDTTAEGGSEKGSMGNALLSKQQHSIVGLHHYAGPSEPEFFSKDMSLLEMHRVISRRILVADIEHDGATHTVAVTHFTWTPDGAPDDRQRSDLKQLLDVLKAHPSVVVCGDFNIPRGTELYHVLNSEYVDNVPYEYTSSLDQKLHRKQGLNLMVDYMWSTSDYAVRDVRMVCGVSDHCALVGEVCKPE